MRFNNPGVPGSSGTVQSLQAGAGIAVDASNPDVPVVSVVAPTPVALASLGSAVTAGAGTRAFISDGLTLGLWGAAAVDGGVVVKPVWSNGTIWLNG